MSAPDAAVGHHSNPPQTAPLRDRLAGGGREPCEPACGAWRGRMTAALSEYDPRVPARAEQKLAAIQERLYGVTGTSAT